MYCTTCGAQNPSSANYCHKDGTALQKEKISFADTQNKKTFCPHCGHSLLGDYVYCPSCGTSLFQVHVGKSRKIDFKNERIEDTPKQARQFFSISSLLNLCKGLHWKQLLLAVATSFIVIFLLSAITVKVVTPSWDDSSLFRTTNYTEELVAYLEDLVDIKIEKPDRVITIDDFVIWLHTVKPIMKVNFTYPWFGKQVGEVHGSFENGFVYLLVIPFVALLAGGVLLGKTLRVNARRLAGHLFAFSFLYAVVLAMLSVFAGFSYHIDLSHRDISASVHAAVKYPFWTALLKGFLVAFLFAGLGILISKGYKRTVHEVVQSIRYGDLIYGGWVWLLRGIVLLFVVLLPFAFLWMSHQVSYDWKLMEEGAALSKLFYAACMAMQLSVWIWGMLHLGVLHLHQDGFKNDHQSVTYSLFSDLDMASVGSTDLYNNVYDLLHHIGFFEREIYIQLLILLPIAIFLYMGYNIRRKYTMAWKPILVFAALYSIGLVVICQFSKVGISYFVSMNGETEAEFSMSIFLEPLSLLVKCFIFSLLFTYAGAWFQQFSRKQRGMK
jgi:hypothetical protein